MVIFLFLRHFWATVFPVAVPLALVATFAVMYPLGYSVNNLTLMAMTIAVGFVVDDAIVMIENIVRYIEKGDTPLEAALKGARRDRLHHRLDHDFAGRRVHPAAADGRHGGVLFREFAVTVTAAVVMSAFVSLTLDAGDVRALPASRDGRTRRAASARPARTPSTAAARYDRGLVWVLDHQPLTLAATVALAVLTGWLYMTIPKGLFPQQDTGFVFVTVEGRQDISFPAMVDAAGRGGQRPLQDPAVESVVAFAGRRRSFPRKIGAHLRAAEAALPAQRLGRPSSSSALRPELAKIQDVNTYLQVSQDLTFGGRLSRTQYQYTLTSLDMAELNHWAPILGERMRGLPKLEDIASDQQIAARHARRRGRPRHGLAARRLAGAIDQTLYDTFGERQVATIYGATTQYKVLLESPASSGAARGAVATLCAGAAGEQVPLCTVARFTDTVAPLTINHQGQFPAVTLSFNLAPGAALSEAVEQIHQLRAELNVPATVDGSFQGMAQAFRIARVDPLLILAAIIAVYIVLGVLYESYIHPITILSTLPSAGVGALLALMAVRLRPLAWSPSSASSC